jgi:tetratricopeptide (TPR) repeat protein
VYQRLQQEPEGFLAELRPSVAVFHQFSGIDYDDETAGDKLDTYIRWVQTTLAHYEGFLIDITMGDKGSYLYIAFGAPIAHEDDATRAVAAAWALQHLPPTCHFITHFQTGISQGQMYAGAYGSPMRRTYGVLGSDVNIAAQLMQSAQPGHILVTERLAQAVDSYAFQALPPLPLKGVAQLLPVFVVQGPGVTTDRPHRQRSHTPLVGRVTERDTLLTRLQALATGESGVVIIEGEAGIGKSRLAEEARQHAQRLHLTVLAGTGDAIDQSTPYHAWRPLFARLFALDVLHDPPARQREHVRARLTADFPDLLARAALLNAVLPLDFPDTALTAQMSGEVRRSNTHQVLLTLLTTAAAVRPLVIALEDAHWFDSASWALTRLVWREVHPLLLIIVTRPLTAPLPLEYHALRDNDAVTHLRLDTMSPADIDSLICHRLGVHTLPPPVSHLIREKAEGQPLFSEELAYALRDAGLMHIANGDCHLSAEAEDLQALHFPDTVQGIITSRMDRLAPQHVLTLKVASVIGRVFAYRAVQAVYPIATDRAHLSDYLHELERLDITPLATSAPELTYLFKHIITQEVAYNLMSFAQRQQLHRATAEWYERTQPADLSAYYPTLAHHWHQAGVAPKAIEYFDKAGELALHNHANQEAVRFFSAAAHLAEDPQLAATLPVLRRARWQRQLGMAYYELGNLAASRSHLEQALRLLGGRLPRSTTHTVVALLGQTGRQVWHRLRARKPMAGSPAASEHWLECARTYALLSEILYFTAETLLGSTLSLYGLNLAEKAGPTPELARAYANTCIVASLIPVHRLARRYSRLAHETAQHTGQLAAQAHVGNYTAVYAVGAGHWSHAEALIDGAAAAAASLGDQRQWITSQAILAVLRHYQGEFQQAAALNVEVYQAARRIDNLVQQGWGLYTHAESCVRMGRTAEALVLLEQALTVVAGDTKRTAQIRIYGSFAAAYWRHDQPILARQMADKALDLMAQAPANVYSALEAYAGVAEVYLGLWERALETALDSGHAPLSTDMRAYAQQACQVVRRYARLFPIGRPRAHLWQGLWYWLAGRADQATRLWHQGLTAAQRFQMPYEQGLTYYELGRHLPRSDPQRQAYLQHAIAIFEGLEAAYDAAQARGALRGASSTVL